MPSVRGKEAYGAISWESVGWGITRAISLCGLPLGALILCFLGRRFSVKKRRSARFYCNIAIWDYSGILFGLGKRGHLDESFVQEG